MNDLTNDELEGAVRCKSCGAPILVAERKDGLLKAAAPDLYEALALALPWLEQRSNDETVAAARAALAAARGDRHG